MKKQSAASSPQEKPTTDRTTLHPGAIDSGTAGSTGVTGGESFPEGVTEQEKAAIRRSKAIRLVQFHPEDRVDKPVEHKKAHSLNRTRITYRISMTIFVIIACIVAVFALMPIVLTVLNSFMSSTEINVNYGVIFNSLSGSAGGATTYLATEPHLKLIPDMASLEQYETVLFKSPTYLLKFWNSVTLVVPIVVFQMAVGSLAAYSFARYRKRGREILFFAYIILMLMPFQVTLVPNYVIADKLGILNTPQAIILPGIFSTFSVFLLSKYMRQIPSSYIEAAKLDGAGEWHIFTRICMPMCKSALYAMGILLFIDYWNMVEQPLILLTDPEKQPLSVFLSQINSGEVGIAFAASFIFMIPPLLIFLNGEQYLIEGISRSGIK